MSDRRLIQIWYDVNAEVLRYSPSGNEVRLASLPHITFRETPLVNLQLVTDSDLTAYTGLPAGLTYEAAIDSAFVSSALMCKTLTSGINVAGDWGAAAGTADPTAGQISIRLNGNTTGFQSKIGSDAELMSTKLEVQAQGAGDIIFQVFVMPFRTFNLINSDGAEPAEYSENFEWFEQDGVQCLRILNDAGEVLQTLCPAGACS